MISNYYKAFQNEIMYQLVCDLVVCIPLFVNPRCACAARVTVVSCVSVCSHAILVVRAIKSIIKDNIV